MAEETKTPNPNNTVTLKLPSWLMTASKVKDYAKQTVDKTVDKSAEFKDKKLPNPLIKLPLNSLIEKTSQFIAIGMKYPKISLSILFVAFALFLVVVLMGSNGRNPVVSGITSNTNYTPDSSVEVNKLIEIPIRQQDGSETGDALKIKFTTIDKSERILIKGQGATARDGKVFLILNMEIENNTTNQLTVRPVDFIRLVEDDERSFAPDVHNDDVDVEAISIKKTRVGYVVNGEDSIFRFAIGEISGDKDLIEVEI